MQLTDQEKVMLEQKQGKFILLFFRLRPCALAEARQRSKSALKGFVEQLPYPALQAAAQRPTGANSGDIAGAAFSLYSVLVFDMLVRLFDLPEGCVFSQRRNPNQRHIVDNCSHL